MSRIAEAQGVLDQQVLLRESIVSGYALAQSGDYVVRPDSATVDDGLFVSVVVINMATGRRQRAIVSANYQNFGLWNLYDPERGVLYQDGIGLATGTYRWSRKHEVWPSGKGQTIEICLLAIPIKPPQ